MAALAQILDIEADFFVAEFLVARQVVGVPAAAHADGFKACGFEVFDEQVLGIVLAFERQLYLHEVAGAQWRVAGDFGALVVLESVKAALRLDVESGGGQRFFLAEERERGAGVERR